MTDPHRQLHEESEHSFLKQFSNTSWIVTLNKMDHLPFASEDRLKLKNKVLNVSDSISTELKKPGSIGLLALSTMKTDPTQSGLDELKKILDNLSDENKSSVLKTRTSILGLERG